MKDKIIEILDKKKVPLNETKILYMLELKETESLTELCSNLREMEVKGEVYRTGKGEYTLYKYTHLKVGRLSVNKKGFGFLILEDEPDIYISSSNLNGAIHNDLVVVDRINKEEGKVLKVIDRNLNNIVGELVFEDNKYFVHVDSDKARLDIIIEDTERNNAMPGHIVLVEPHNQIRGNLYQGKIVKILGHKDDPGIDILSIVYEHNINDVFPEDVIKEADSLPLEINPKDIEGRRDLRDLEAFTIDGDDAKDFDQANSIKRLDNGNYLLSTHIADVCHYVKEGSALYKEALERGTSVYLVDRVIPMLPHKLSNGICSLNPNVDRLTFTCDMEIDSNGNVLKYDIYKSVINSKKRMTYKNANKVLNGEVVEDYESFRESLTMMADLSKILRRNKLNRGYIDFNIDEPKIIVDERCKPIDITVRKRDIGENLIEDTMIVTNETVAEYVYHLDYPFIYRVHDKPKEEKVKNFLNILGTLGYKIKGKAKSISPKFMQGILDMVKGTKDASVISEVGLRSMQKAIYSAENIGHFGLASKCYTHFTAPNRRYPDLIVQTLLSKYLSGEELSNDTLKSINENLIFIADHSSSKEKDSVECERDVDDMKMAEYMQDHIGEEYNGVISGVIPSGIFVRLPNLIEGFVHISTLNDYYEFNEKAQMFIGRKSKKRYRLGDEVKVKVIQASKEERTIDFIMM